MLLYHVCVHMLQMDLGNISSEIQTLQEQSVSLNSKLKNRQVCMCMMSCIDHM